MNWYDVTSKKEAMPLKFRHEWKHEITYADLITIRQRLRAVEQPDVHGVNGTYHIRSLYFDTPTDRALRDKLDGVNYREKFRIRCYDGNHSLIHLEKKTKVNDLCDKVSADLTVAETRAILSGDLDWMLNSPQEPVRELYTKMTLQGLRPKTIVDYTRDAFVYPAGNVRVTLDYNIRTGLRSTDFLDPNCPTVPAGAAPIILEVKWDEFLPDLIRDAVQLPNRRAGAFSKYAACRIYG